MVEYRGSALGMLIAGGLILLTSPLWAKAMTMAAAWLSRRLLDRPLEAIVSRRKALRISLGVYIAIGLVFIGLGVIRMLQNA
jgi:hypothetical protein